MDHMDQGQHALDPFLDQTDHDSHGLHVMDHMGHPTADGNSPSVTMDHLPLIHGLPSLVHEPPSLVHGSPIF